MMNSDFKGESEWSIVMGDNHVGLIPSRSFVITSFIHIFAYQFNDHDDNKDKMNYVPAPLSFTIVLALFLCRACILFLIYCIFKVICKVSCKKNDIEQKELNDGHYQIIVTNN